MEPHFLVPFVACGRRVCRFLSSGRWAQEFVVVLGGVLAGLAELFLAGFQGTSDRFDAAHREIRGVVDRQGRPLPRHFSSLYQT